MATADYSADQPLTTTEAPSAEFPQGKFGDESETDAFDGTKGNAKLFNDWNGFFGWLLTQGQITPSDTPETALDSDFGDALSKVLANYAAAGYVYDDSGTANAYVLGIKNGRQPITYLQDGMVVEFVPDNANTGPATADLISVKGIRDFSGVAFVGGEMTAGQPFRMRFNFASDHWRVDLPSSSSTIKGLVELATQSEGNAGTDAVRAITASVLKNLTATLPNVSIGGSSGNSSKVAGQRIFRGFFSSTLTTTVLPSGWSVVKGGTGIYVITTNLGTGISFNNTSTTANANVTGRTISHAPGTGSGDEITLTSTTSAANAAVDAGIYFIVVTSL